MGTSSEYIQLPGSIVQLRLRQYHVTVKKGIYFKNSTYDGLTKLDYCIIEYAGETNNANVYFNSAAPTITNTTISNSSSHGIYFAIGSPTIANSSLNDNDLYPISTNPNDCSNFSSNTASGNGIANSIQIRGGRVVRASLEPVRVRQRRV